MFKLFHNLGRIKERSEKRLSELGIAFNKDLPVLERINGKKSRSSREIARRIIALWEVVNSATNGNRATKAESVGFLKDIGLWNGLPSSEKKFLEDETVDKQSVINFTWRTEVLKVLYWSIGEIDELEEPIEEKHLLKVNEAVLNKYPTIESFIESVRLRNFQEILSEADFVYRLHWSIRSHRRERCFVPQQYEYSVVYERDFALRWITQVGTSWDEITCDT